MQATGFSFCPILLKAKIGVEEAEQKEHWCWRRLMQQIAKERNKWIMEQIKSEFSSESQMTIMVILSEDTFP